jgi:MerR family transcriptional regulator, light-induced transcriptional regulator
MPQIDQPFVERFFETIIAGDRPGARELISLCLDRGITPQQLLTDLFWPTHQLVDRLQREGQLEALNHHMATRLLRVMVDQTSAQLVRQPSRNRSILAFCGESEGDELGAQIAVDLLESCGFDIRFGGGGVAADEILAQVRASKPSVLLMFCSAAKDLPGIRKMIDDLHANGSCREIQIAVGGGVFNRAEGLAEEIGADVWADSPLDMVDTLVCDGEVRTSFEARTVGRARTKKRAAA